MKKTEPFLIHIWEAIEKISSFLTGTTKEDFLQDDRTQLAVIKLLEIIGEAVGHLEEDRKEELTEIDWSKIKAFRNKVIHEYWDIDPEVVWRIAHQDIYVLRDAIQPIVMDIQDTDEDGGNW